MNINELSERNIGDAVAMFKLVAKDYLQFVFSGEESVDEQITRSLLDDEANGDFTYLFYDKITLLAMATVAKSTAEIKNLFVNFNLVDENFVLKLLEFVVKQFSSITRVFVWVSSLDAKLSEIIENYGFEYTGEQTYVSKENNILMFRYIYKRKK